MADYGARWNFPAADRRAPSPTAKRPRREYDRSYDERSGWTAGREGDQLTTTSDLLRNGLSYTGLSSDLALSGVGLGVTGAASLSALGAGLATLDDSSLITQTSQIMGYDVANLTGRSNLSMNNADVLPHDASATLFVDGLPSDCTRREAAHIFRPFIGFKEVRLVHKDAKRATGEKLVLCFVEFVDAKCAATALEALQGTACSTPMTLLHLALWVKFLSIAVVLLVSGKRLAAPDDGQDPAQLQASVSGFLVLFTTHRACESWEMHILVYYHPLVCKGLAFRELESSSIGDSSSRHGKTISKTIDRGLKRKNLRDSVAKSFDLKPCAGFAGYKFDENDPDSYVLRLTFARYGPRGAPRARSPLRVRDRSPYQRDRRR